MHNKVQHFLLSIGPSCLNYYDKSQTCCMWGKRSN